MVQNLFFYIFDFECELRSLYQNYVIKTVWQLTLHFETDETIKLQTLLKFLQGLHVKYLSYGFSIQKKKIELR